MDLKTFNVELNKSYSSDQKFGEWAEYRKEVTALVLKNLSVDESTILVLGAGNCHDLDLKALTKGGQQLILTDIDGISMNEGLMRQKAEAKIIEVDYLGLSDWDWLEELQRICLNGHQMDYTHWLSKLTATVKEDHLVWHGDKVDVTICLPLYTQLLFGQVEGQLRHYWLTDVLQEVQYKAYLRQLLDAMPEVIHHFNKGLLDLNQKGSQLIVFSDCLEDRPDGPYSVSYAEGKFEEMYEQYCQKYGMGLGHYGLYDIEKQVAIIDSQWFQWPFAKDRVLFVRAIIIKAD